jgi:Gram-negative bacterial TonB protein C-terminal
MGWLLLLLLSHLCAACEKRSVNLRPAEMSKRIVTRTLIVPQAHVARITGSIELFLEIDAEGKPSCISVVRGHPILTSAAISSLKDWRFRPYRVKGKLVTYSGSLVLYAKNFADV